MPTDAVIKKDKLADDTIGSHLKQSGVSRRDFVTLCGMLMAAAPMGLALTEKAKSVEQLANTVAKAKRPSVIWLHFQDCTGCSETLLRTSAPDVADLILNVISLDYHETLMAASGYQAEKSLKDAAEANAGKFILVCEGSVPLKDGGQYLTLAGVKGVDRLKEIASKAAAVVSMGSCASWGGVPSADPNPTGAVGIDQIITDKPVVNLPGCPPNPYNLLGVVLEFVTLGKLPALDQYGRPKFAYDRLIHDHCPRRAHFDAGRFVKEFGDEGHRQGWCLYKMGCKGPATHAGCSTRHFNETPDVWPIGIGAPCVGCTEKAVAFRVPIFQTIDLHTVTPPETYPLINARVGSIGVAAAAVAGAVAGGLGTAAWMAAQKLPSSKETQGPEDPSDKSNSAKAGGQ
ncbi:MAG TPA: hydrogenase small subunit [Terriglobales bacterium]|nr:hydrogenase small subunit [Terriglobales bacterium]